ncbi:MAG: isochorismatase family cysteine hydrolase [Clostridia bacterium]
MSTQNALVIIDFQNDFVTGSLGFPKAKTLDDVICKLAKSAIDNSDDIIFTKDTHFDNYLATKEGINLPIPHCINGTLGHEIYGNTAKFLPFATECFTKETFGSIPLAKFIRDSGYENVTLVGLVSNICVLTNAILIQSYCPNTNIIVDSSATSCFDENSNTNALDVLKGLFITVI